MCAQKIMRSALTYLNGGLVFPAESACFFLCEKDVGDIIVFEVMG